MTRTFWRFWPADSPSAVSVIAVCLITAISAIACDPGAGVTWVNETDQTLIVYLSDEPDSDRGDPLPPHSTKVLGVIEVVWKDVVVIRDEQGNVLFRQELTWDEFKAMGFRFVITEDMLSPTPTGGPWQSPRPRIDFIHDRNFMEWWANR